MEDSAEENGNHSLGTVRKRYFLGIYTKTSKKNKGAAQMVVHDIDENEFITTAQGLVFKNKNHKNASDNVIMVSLSSSPQKKT